MDTVFLRKGWSVGRHQQGSVTKDREWAFESSGRDRQEWTLKTPPIIRRL
ncbi:hypothetical protein Pen02_60600 [Plantactinospora endophytica]|uniref:Uncharacterized protein n=1 Tax=Plantactinospora endophytica TaxID=673535 RepID=A0ABQ4E8U4_9ACTN|nr:hypothetical protein Pen02_60600 [Plantactinospora endophytica]